MKHEILSCHMYIFAKKKRNRLLKVTFCLKHKSSWTQSSSSSSLQIDSRSAHSFLLVVFAQVMYVHHHHHTARHTNDHLRHHHHHHHYCQHNNNIYYFHYQNRKPTKLQLCFHCFSFFYLFLWTLLAAGRFPSFLYPFQKTIYSTIITHIFPHKSFFKH